MRVRFSSTPWVIGMLATFAGACGGGDRNRDGSVMLMDSQPMGVDAPPTDTGPPSDGTPSSDGGGGPRMCNAGGACDVIAQNCPATQGCYYARSMMGGKPTTMCAEVTRSGGDGAPCEFVNECLPGFTCNAGVCRRYCCMGRTSDCPAGQICIGIAETGIGQCTLHAECTLVPNEGCMMNQGCYLISADGTLGCVIAGMLDEGATCAYLNDCRPGLGCFGVMGGTAMMCMRFCRMSMADTDCGTGRRCVVVRGLPEGIGVCQ